MNNVAGQQQFSQLLKAELDCTKYLAKVLDEEHEALSQSDAPRITSISKEKLACLQKLEKHFAERERFLSTLGLPAGKTGTENFIQSLSQGSPIAAQWQELLTLTQKVQRQNEINGGIIILAQRHTATALDILSGREPMAGTYGPDGESRSDCAAHSIAKA